MLKSLEYINLIKNIINQAKHTYALNPRNITYINNDNGENLELKIPISLFINTLSCLIRGETIIFSKMKAREARDQENKLIKEIDETECQIDSDPDHSNDKLQKLENLNKTELRTDKLKGHQIRSRYQHFKDWEKPSKYFLNLEKKNYINKNIIELIDKKTFSDFSEILKEQALFYLELFTSKGSKLEEHTRYTHLLDNLPTISENTKIETDAEITLEEVEESIKNSKNNKAPGPDGFSNEFFKVFSHQLKHWILRLFKESIDVKLLKPYWKV